jgi:hypothetical protein
MLDQRPAHATRTETGGNSGEDESKRKSKRPLAARPRDAREQHKRNCGRIEQRLGRSREVK